MPTYKVIATLTWQFDSEKGHNECLAQAKRQLDQVLPFRPHGEDFYGFTTQVDLARMKDRKRLIHLGVFEPDEVLPYITENDSRRDYQVQDKVYRVRMNSDRYHVFKKNLCCVVCGLRGSKMILDQNPGDSTPHFNLYAEEQGRLVLMTKDHTLAKSKGGKDCHSNYCSMCATCNNLKGAYSLTNQQVLELRKMWENPDKLPRKELRDLINIRREILAATNAQKEENEYKRFDTTEDIRGEASEVVLSNKTTG